MNNQPIPTRPPSGEDKLLQEKFAEAIVNQSEQLDRLAQQLLTLELAIPGLYATVLKLVSGDKAIEDFFHETARYKHRLVLVASLFFFAGTFFAALTIF